VVRDPRPEAGIAGKESVHPIAVAGEDHHQILALRFHHLQQNLDRLLAVVALVIRSMQVICFIDEQPRPSLFSGFPWLPLLVASRLRSYAADFPMHRAAGL
jgi:hypothetical protein